MNKTMAKRLRFLLEERGYESCMNECQNRDEETTRYSVSYWMHPDGRLKTILGSHKVCEQHWLEEEVK